MIGLRDLTKEDCETIRIWRNSPEVSRWALSDHEIEEAEHARWFKDISTDKRVKYWIITLDGKDVGLVNLFNIDTYSSRCFYGIYLVDPVTRGKGVGSYVLYCILQYGFTCLKLNKICGEVLADNHTMIHLQAQFGFQKEGHLTKHIRKGEAWVDVTLWGLFRGDWNRHRPEIECILRSKGFSLDTGFLK